eukprot:510029-Prymnesium_polylepis.1
MARLAGAPIGAPAVGPVEAQPRAADAVARGRRDIALRPAAAQHDRWRRLRQVRTRRRGSRRRRREHDARRQVVVVGRVHMYLIGV